jgi:glycosyltransferase involved in cell wall biosynthesis
VPRVSIVIPAYNAAATIRATIESVIAQTFRDIEVIVVDDGSTDRTCEIVREFGSRVRLIEQHNNGPAAARK